jgi:hypothetical protein
LAPDQPGQAGSDNAGNLITASSQVDLDQLFTQLTAARSAGDQGAISQILIQIENLAGAISGRAPQPAKEGAGTIVLAAESAGELTRVGRWMSQEEFNLMSETGRVVEGAGGRTYVVRPPNPGSYTGARPGSVYAEFDVPTSVLKPASKPEWAVIPGPNITTRIFGPTPTELAPATCIVCVIRGP